MGPGAPVPPAGPAMCAVSTFAHQASGAASGASVGDAAMAIHCRMCVVCMSEAIGQVELLNGCLPLCHTLVPTPFYCSTPNPCAVVMQGVKYNITWPSALAPTSPITITFWKGTDCGFAAPLWSSAALSPAVSGFVSFVELQVPDSILGDDVFLRVQGAAASDRNYTDIFSVQKRAVVTPAGCVNNPRLRAAQPPAPPPAHCKPWLAWNLTQLATGLCEIKATGCREYRWVARLRSSSRTVWHKALHCQATARPLFRPAAAPHDRSYACSSLLSPFCPHIFALPGRPGRRARGTPASSRYQTALPSTRQTQAARCWRLQGWRWGPGSLARPLRAADTQPMACAVGGTGQTRAETGPKLP